MHTRKQIDAPRTPMILSNSGNKIAKDTNMALTPTRIVTLPMIFNPFVVQLSELPWVLNMLSNVWMIGFAFSGVFASGIKQINPEING